MPGTSIHIVPLARRLFVHFLILFSARCLGDEMTSPGHFLCPVMGRPSLSACHALRLRIVMLLS